MIYVIEDTHGNHKNYEKLNEYEMTNWNGGKVHQIRKNLIHLIRDEVYEIEEKNFFYEWRLFAG